MVVVCANGIECKLNEEQTEHQNVHRNHQFRIFYIVRARDGGRLSFLPLLSSKIAAAAAGALRARISSRQASWYIINAPVTAPGLRIRLPRSKAHATERAHDAVSCLDELRRMAKSHKRATQQR